MCGIVGFTGGGPLREAILAEMMRRIVHRGPDGAGTFFDQGIALGHRRLSIIDLEGGRQPMENEDGSLVVIFNGEIYNFQSLREELRLAGHEFVTRSDTEVLLHGYEEWGEQMLQRLRGMFSFALWDRTQQALFCARDFFGIKPFYYYTTPKKPDLFLFGSEIKSFLAHPDFEKKLNEAQLERYLTYQYSPSEETFFEGVRKLPPAHYLRWKAGNLTIARYWTPEFSADPAPSRAEWADRIEAVMKDSVAAHRIADVKVGSFLSSGVDSSYLTALSGVHETFTAGFSDPRYDETAYAERFSASLGIRNFTHRLTAEELWAELPAIQYQIDEPLGDAAAAALYFVNQEAAKHVKVCLSGEGADELFGGYNVYREPFTAQWYDRLPAGLRRGLGAAAERLPQVRGVNFLVRRALPIPERYIGGTKLFSERQKAQLLRRYQADPADPARALFALSEGQDDVTRMQTTDLQLWLVGDILLKADKMSMANSLELRVPFLDREVFEVARRIPVEDRVSRDQTKVALRDAARRMVPEATAAKRKLGFPVPVRAWLREPRWSEQVRELFHSEAAAEFFHTEYLDRLLTQHVEGTRDNWREIWCVYMFLIWYREFFSPEGRAASGLA